MYCSWIETAWLLPALEGWTCLCSLCDCLGVLLLSTWTQTRMLLSSCLWSLWAGNPAGALAPGRLHWICILAAFLAPAVCLGCLLSSRSSSFFLFPRSQHGSWDNRQGLGQDLACQFSCAWLALGESVLAMLGTTSYLDNMVSTSIIFFDLPQQCINQAEQAWPSPLGLRWETWKSGDGSRPWLLENRAGSQLQAFWLLPQGSRCMLVRLIPLKS